MNRVTVNLYASLRRHISGKASVEFDVDSGQTVGEVLDELGVPADQTRIIFINGRAAERSSPLSGGDRLGAFPAIGGG